MRKWLTVAALFWLLLLGIPADAYARSCVYTGPLCSRWQEYDAIFDGTVTAIRRVDQEVNLGGQPRTWPSRMVTFKIHDRWRGAEGNEIELLLSGGYGTWTSNSFSVEEGKRYLIFARRWNGQLSTSTCDPSAEYGKSGPTLEFLQSLRQPPTGARIFGQVGQAWSTFDDDSTPRRLPNTTVTLSGPGYRQTVEPRNGAFEFSRLSPGTYSLEIAPVAMMTGHFTQPVTLADARACAEFSAYFNHDTAIAGVLVAARGGPAANVNVELTRAGTWRKELLRTMSARSDHAGHFEFRGMPPGEYVVALNVRDQVAYDPYPRTMYADAAGSPETIRVAAGQHVELSPWTIGAPLEKVRLRLRLVDPQGRPVAGESVSLFDVTNREVPDFIQQVMGSKTTAEGTVEFDARLGRSYIIVRGHRLTSGVARTEAFTPQKGTAPVTLVLLAR